LPRPARLILVVVERLAGRPAERQNQMLTVKILNLRQDENNHADYVVHINTTLERLDYFLIKGFDRARGWRELLTEVVKKVEQGATGARRFPQ